MYIVVCTKDQQYDCILTNQIFGDERQAQAAIDQAQEEDKYAGWEYDYEIVPIQPPVENLTCERCHDNPAAVWLDDTATCYSCMRDMQQERTP